MHNKLFYDQVKYVLGNFHKLCKLSVYTMQLVTGFLKDSHWKIIRYLINDFMLFELFYFEKL